MLQDFLHLISHRMDLAKGSYLSENKQGKEGHGLKRMGKGRKVRKFHLEVKNNDETQQFSSSKPEVFF